MNKYIDHLTVAEYKTIRGCLKDQVDQLKDNLQNEKTRKKYIEIRFIILKIDSIIKKYDKTI